MNVLFNKTAKENKKARQAKLAELAEKYRGIDIYKMVNTDCVIQEDLMIDEYGNPKFLINYGTEEKPFFNRSIECMRYELKVLREDLKAMKKKNSDQYNRERDIMIGISSRTERIYTISKMERKSDKEAKVEEKARKKFERKKKRIVNKLVKKAAKKGYEQEDLDDIRKEAEGFAAITIKLKAEKKTRRIERINNIIPYISLAVSAVAGAISAVKNGKKLIKWGISKFAKEVVTSAEVATEIVAEVF